MAWSNWTTLANRLVNSFGTYSHIYEISTYRYNRDGNTVNYEIKITLKYTNDTGGRGHYDDEIGTRIKFNGSSSYSSWKTITSGLIWWDDGDTMGSVTFTGYSVTAASGSVPIVIQTNNRVTSGFDNPTSPTYNMTLPTQTYTLTYNANGGSSTPSSQTKTHGTAINLRGAITRNNSTVNGYTVSFNGNEGTYSGTSLTAIDTTTYAFAGWKSSGSSTVYAAGASFNENGNTTLTAQWTPSTILGSITLPAASTVTRQYYTFNKWNTNSAGTGTEYSAGATYTPSSNTTLYATWTPNAPINLYLGYWDSTTNSISLSCTDEGVVTSRTAYYRKRGTSQYSSVAITSDPFTISGLESDTDYEIYYTASNSAASTSSATVIFSTELNNPIISVVNLLELTPFTATIEVIASVVPSRTLTYQFSLDGETWSSAQSSNTYQFDGLEEETDYDLYVKVTAAHTGVSAFDTSDQSKIEITTPADQAKIWYKSSSGWIRGKAYLKKDGEWVKAKKVYIKDNNEWKINSNQE